MIDLHCHILPGIDDGAADLSTASAMARAMVADGVTVVACTPHILPGLYHNTGPLIRAAIARLQRTLDFAGIELRLVGGADVHIAPDVVAGLRAGRLLSLAESRYVLIEPPHHVAPPRMESLFSGMLDAGYVPVLTHPERLQWIKSHYELIGNLAALGVWMQITSGSLSGEFGTQAKYWAEKLLDDGLVHILATDSHDMGRRSPNLSRGRDLAAERVGEERAVHLVLTRPRGVIEDVSPADLPAPARNVANSRGNNAGAVSNAKVRQASAWPGDGADRHNGAGGRWLSRRLRGVFDNGNDR